jgi:hypothetical protein
MDFTTSTAAWKIESEKVVAEMDQLEAAYPRVWEEAYGEAVAELKRVVPTLSPDNLAVAARLRVLGDKAHELLNVRIAKFKARNPVGTLVYDKEFKTQGVISRYLTGKDYGDVDVTTPGMSTVVVSWVDLAAVTLTAPFNLLERVAFRHPGGKFLTGEVTCIPRGFGEAFYAIKPDEWDSYGHHFYRPGCVLCRLPKGE